jgi:hypothetical protein
LYPQALYGSNTAYYASNTAIYASNLAVGSSNDLYPRALYSSNTAYYASNLAVNSSNDVFPRALYSSNTAYYASNLAVNSSNDIFPRALYGSNTAYYASNTAYYASNLAVNSSNDIFPRALYSSNTAYYASNTAYYASNLAVSSSNDVFPRAVYSSNTAYYASNLAVAASNRAYSSGIGGGQWTTNANNNIYITSSNVGIGTSTPTQTFEVNGASANMMFVTEGGALIFSSNIANPGSSFAAMISRASANGLYANDATKGDLVVRSQWNNVLLVPNQQILGIASLCACSNGYIGIGTSAPFNGLHLSSTSVPAVQLFFSMSNQGVDGKHWGLGPNGNTFYGYTYNDALDASVDWLRVVRSGNTISSVSFPNGQFTIGKATGAVSMILSDIATAAWQISTGGYNLGFNINNGVDNAWVNKMLLTSAGNLTVTGNVGIGTTNPLSALTIKNNYATGQSGGFCIDATDGAVYNLRLFSYVQAGAQVGYQFVVNNLASTSQSLVLGYDGYVGIGTSNPLFKLHNALGSVFIGNSTYASTTIPANVAGNISANGYRLVFDNSYNTTAGVGMTANKIVLHNNGGAWGFGIENAAVTYHSGNSHRFYVGSGLSTYGTLGMTLNSSGNLAIGTESPNYKLDVAGDINTNATMRSVTFSNSANIQLGGDICMNNTQMIQCKNSTGGYELFVHPRWSDNITYMNFGSGGFNIRNNASSSVMFMQNGGNVGIGTTDPSYKLDVAGTIRSSTTAQSTGNLVISSSIGSVSFIANAGAGQSNSITQAGDSFIQFNGNTGIDSGNLVIAPWSSSSAGIRILGANGYVGIGTPSPGAKLHVMGDVLANSIYPITTNAYSLGSDSNRFNSAYITTGYIYSQLGIGTTSPNASYKLDVAGSGRFTDTVNTASITTTKNNGVNALFGATNGNAIAMSGTSGNANLVLGFNQWWNSAGWATGNYTSCYSSGFVYNTTSGTLTYQGTTAAHQNAFNPAMNNNILTILNSGNVGIDTASPAYKLDVAGTIRLGANAVNNKLLVLFDHNAGESLSTGIDFYGLGINGGTLRYQVPSGCAHKWYSGSTNTTTIDGSGNLYSTSLITGTGSGGGLLISDIPNASWRICGGSYNLNFMNDNGGWGNKVTFTHTGNVGIGTTSPSAKLHVLTTSYTGDPDSGGIYCYNSTIGQKNSICVRTNQSGSPFYSMDIEGQIGWSIGLDSSEDRKFKFRNSWNFTGNALMAIDTSGNVTATDFTTTSDMRKKKDITPIENALEKVDQLQGVTYKFKESDEKEKIGLIAQDVQKVIPQVVYEDTDGFLSISYGHIVSVLIEAIKELRKENKKSAETIRALQTDHEIMKEQITYLMGKIA